MKIKVRADGLAEAAGPREDILALEALLLEVGVQYSTCFGVLASVGVTVWQGDLSEPSDEVTVIDLLDAAIAVDKWRERLAVLERRLPEGVTRDVVEVAVLKLRQAVNRLSEEAGDRGKVLVECDPKPYDDACAGCGCQPGDGRTPGCSDPEGCGYNS